MTAGRAIFQEATATPKVAAVPLAHLSIELGHLYAEDYDSGPKMLDRHFQQAAVWAQAARQSVLAAMGRRTPRISTCFLVDDYFTKFSSPVEIIPQLTEAAANAGLSIDYLARESGCARVGDLDLAGLVESQLVTEPPPGTNGVRPPVTEVGWLCNGERSPSGVDEAMNRAPEWRPPQQNAIRRHSVFLDVELWDENGPQRTWSCPFLAAVWQLLRLGLLRADGAVVAAPVTMTGGFPEQWDELPEVVRLNESAAPFWAYRTQSILGGRFLSIEHAVRTILSQVLVDDAVATQVADRAGRERLALPAEVVERIEYVFTGPDW